MFHHLRNFIPSILLLAVIAYLSLADFSSIHINPSIPNVDKLVHFCMYLALSYVFLFDLTHNVNDRTIRHINCWCAFIIPTLTGVVLEILQGYATTTRSFDFYDMLANMLGAAFGTGLGFFTLPYVFKYFFFHSFDEQSKKK